LALALFLKKNNESFYLFVKGIGIGGGCNLAGGHYDPFKTETHGGPLIDWPHHLGDLGNIESVDKNGQVIALLAAL
jgi:Cu/Zn superoxide dismutase